MAKEDIAARLKLAREAARFPSARAASDALGVPYATYAGHENGSRGVEVEAATHYARRYKVSLDWLLDGKGAGPGAGTAGQSPAVPRMVRVKGYVQAGHWSETWELPDDDQYEVAVPNDAALAGVTLHAAETRGPSMNRRYPEGTVLVFADAIESGEEFIAGKRYIIERERADGLKEATVKRLWQDEAGQFWLLPESDDPRFQEPIAVDGGDDDTIRIVGRVRYSVSRE